jgi:cell division protein FtsI (penicillin-binding protein 3)
VIEAPAGAEYYGGEVAAPVFSRVINGAMRILDVAPDDLSPLMHAEQNQASNEGARG